MNKLIKVIILSLFVFSCSTVPVYSIGTTKLFSIERSTVCENLLDQISVNNNKLARLYSKDVLTLRDFKRIYALESHNEDIYITLGERLC